MWESLGDSTTRRIVLLAVYQLRNTHFNDTGKRCVGLIFCPHVRIPLLSLHRKLAAAQVFTACVSRPYFRVSVGPVHLAQRPSGSFIQDFTAHGIMPAISPCFYTLPLSSQALLWGASRIWGRLTLSRKLVAMTATALPYALFGHWLWQTFRVQKLQCISVKQYLVI